MGSHVMVNGHSTWVDQRGAGDEVVVLLHGGMSHSDLMFDTLGALGETYRLVGFDRSGHGYTADADGPWHYDAMATETIGVLETVVGGAAHLVGYSDGGIVALLVALRRPDLVSRMVVIGTNFHAHGLHPDFLEGMSASPEMTAWMAGEYAQRSPDGVDHFPVAFEKFSTMAASEPTLTADDLGGITAPTLVLVGDDDGISLAHTCALYESLPHGQLCVLPAASHAVVVEQAELTTRMISEFLARPASPTTLIPIRRRG